jgi:hypothetical protein
VSEETGVLGSVEEMVRRFEEEVVAGLDELLTSSDTNTYSSHVLRVYLEHNTPSAPFTDALLKEWAAHWKSQFAAPVLQAVLLKQPSLVQSHLMPHMDRAFFLAACRDKIGSRTCESFLEAASKHSSDLFTQVYQSFIRNDTTKLAQDRNGNFVVQALVSSCPSDPLFRVIVGELESISSEIVVGGKMGILFKIVDWPVRHGRAFDTAVGFLYDCFQAKTPGERQAVVSALCKSKLGSSILALFPRYPPDANKYIVDGFLDLSESELRDMALDRTAAHCLESFLNTAHTNVSQKARLKICRKLISSPQTVVDMAISPSGSFVLERLFQAASIDLKEVVAGHLAAARKRVEESRAGLICLRKFAVEQFEREREQWRRVVLSGDKKRSILDLVNDDDTAVSGKGGAKKESKKAPRHY